MSIKAAMLLTGVINDAHGGLTKVIRRQLQDCRLPTQRVQAVRPLSPGAYAHGFWAASTRANEAERGLMGGGMGHSSATRSCPIKSRSFT